MDKELENLLDNYENVIYGKAFPITPSTHQLHLLLDYIANLEQLMLKDNPIKIIKCGDIEIPVEYLKQTTINVNSYDYIRLQQENQQLKDKLSKIETLIINHNCDTGDIYYKYNSKFLKSELKQRILEMVYEEGSDSDE